MGAQSSQRDFCPTQLTLSPQPSYHEMSLRRRCLRLSVRQESETIDSSHAQTQLFIIHIDCGHVLAIPFRRSAFRFDKNGLANPNILFPTRGKDECLSLTKRAEGIPPPPPRNLPFTFQKQLGALVTSGWPSVSLGVDRQTASMSSPGLFESVSTGNPGAEEPLEECLYGFFRSRNWRDLLGFIS